MDDLIEVLVKESKPDFTTGQYKIVLKVKKSDLVLSIWVGYFEGNSIALSLEDTWSPRPMTHDLIRNLIQTMKAEVNHILVNELKDNTFYATISLVVGGNTMAIDSRPSDAIALALRTKSPIFVEETVIEAAKSLEIPEMETSKKDEKQQWKDWLDNIKPEDFGKL